MQRLRGSESGRGQADQNGCYLNSSNGELWGQVGDEKTRQDGPEHRAKSLALS